MYWLVAGSVQILDRNNFAYRLPTVFLAILAGLLTVRFGSEIADEETGALGGLLLVTSYEFVRHGRIATYDIALTAFVLASCYCFYRWLHGKGSGWIYGAFVALGIGFLTKGPVALLFPLLGSLIYVSFALARRDYRGPTGLRLIHLLPAVALFFAIAVPWYWVVAEMRPEAWEIWQQETLARAGQEADHAKGGFYYIPTLLGDILPWTLFVILGGVFLVRRRQWVDKPGLLYSVCWLLGGLLFLHFFASKRGTYLLPLYPPLCLVVGYYLGQVFERQPLVTVTERWAFRIYAGLLVVAGIAFPVFLLMGFEQGRTIAIATGVLIVALGILAFDALRQFNYRGVFYNTLLVTVIFFMVWNGFFYPIRALRDVEEERQQIEEEHNEQAAVSVHRYPSL